MGHPNRRRLFLSFTLLLAAASAWGCGVVDWIIGGNIDVNGARATISQERANAGNSTWGYVAFGTQNQFRKVDVVSLLSGGQKCTTSAVFDTAQEQQACMEWAFDCFNYYAPHQCPPLNPAPAATLAPLSQPTPDAASQQRRRNAVQERLIAASNSACREFTQHLNTYQSYTNSFLGTAAVGTGAAGAIVSGVVAARALAGVTGALAGTRAEFNSDIFAKQIVTTIVQAIDKSRQSYLIKIRGSEVEGTAEQATSTSTGAAADSAGPKKAAQEPGATEIGGKESLPIEKYSVEAAIADAIYYNDLCSLDKGLQTLTQSLSTAGNPGLDEFYGEVQKYNEIRDAMRRGAPAPLAAPATEKGEAVNRRRAR